MTTEADIRQMIEGGESGTVEFKIKAPRAGELAERICGMANSRTGGAILFGIEDSTGQIVGVQKPNETIDVVLRATRLVRPAAPLLDGHPSIWNIDNHPIVIAQVPRNDGTLYQAGGVCWMRRGSHTTPMTTEEIAEHLNASGAIRWERNLCVRATLDDLDQVHIDRYLALRAERSRQNLRYTSREELLIGMECAARDSQTNEVKPTNAGMLLFGYDPQWYIPQSEVVCIRYADHLGVGKYIDRKIFTGTLPELIDKTADFLRLHIRVAGEIVGFKRIDLPEYPYEALREAVVNAVAHRDYSRDGETIRIFFYTDRVEIHSPGLLPPGIAIEDLTQLRARSRPRNRLVAQFLREVPGYMERVGAGIRLMVNEMRQMDLPDPEFLEQHEFVVIFRNGQPIDQQLISILNERQIAGLRIIQEKGSLSSSEYCAATGASESTGLRELREMVERGVIVVRGKTRGARYYLP